MDRHDCVSSLARCKQHLPQQGQGMQAPDAAEAWLTVQQERKPQLLLAGGTPTIGPIGALADVGGQGLKAVGCPQAVPEFPEDAQTVESKGSLQALVKAGNRRPAARGSAEDLASEAPDGLRETDPPCGEGTPAPPPAGVLPRELSGRRCIPPYLSAVIDTNVRRRHDPVQGHRSSLHLTIPCPGLYSEVRRADDYFSPVPDRNKVLASSLHPEARRRRRRALDRPSAQKGSDRAL